MQIFFLVIIGFLGMIFGSFASVLISRFYSKEGGIMTGRSHCKDCNHELGALDLVPIFSYIFVGGKCRYCKNKISYSYPLLELIMGISFVLVGIFMVDYNLIFLPSIGEIIKLLFFLYVAFVVVTFSTYDIKYQLIPTEILGPAILILLIMLLSSIFNQNVYDFFSYYIVFDNSFIVKPIYNAILGAFTIYSFLYLQIFLPGIYYAIEKKKYKIILEQFIDFFRIPVYMIYSVFFKDSEKAEEEQKEEEQIYTGMGHGDLWIAVFMGFVGGFKIALLGLVLAYLIGSIVGIYIIFFKRQRNVYIAFGPFLGTGLMIALILYNPIVNYALTILGLRF